MHRSSGVFTRALAIVPLLAAGCGGAPERAPATPPPPARKPCGNEISRHGKGYDAVGRECIWRAYKDREPAEFTTTHYTIEGDPISYRLEITPTGVLVVIDSKDRFGQKGVFRHTCRNFERIMQEESKDRFGFALSGCTGGGASRLAVP